MGLFFFQDHPVFRVGLGVGLGVGGVNVSSGSRPHPSHSCDVCVCDLGVVVVSLIFGLVRGTGSFGVVLPTFVLVSRIQFVERYRVNTTSFIERLLHDLRQWSVAS